MTSDTMDFQIWLNPGDQVYDITGGTWVTAPRPMCGEQVVWQNPSVMITAPDGSSKPYREFAGVITEVKENDDGVALIYDVHVKSYVHWLDRRLVTAWYNQDEPSSVIKKIVQTFAPDFTTYNVQPTSTIVIPQYFDYRKTSDAIKSIADQIEYGYYVDYFKDVHFYSLETITSPLPNNTLDVDNDVTNYGDLEITENSQQQFNSIFIKGFKTRSDNFMTLTFQADGQTAQWNLGYRVSSVKGDVAVSVYSSYAAYQADGGFASGGTPTGGTAMTIKKDLIDGAPNRGGDADTAYIHYTQHICRIPNFNGSGVIPAGYIVAVRFYYLRDLVYYASDPQAQQATAAIEGGTTGRYDYVHTDKSLSNSTLSAVQAKGQLMLQKYRYPQVGGTFTTYFNGTTQIGWRAGQYFTFKSARRFGGMDEIMFVQRVLKSIVKNDSGGLVAFYNIEFADSPYLV
jgi:hypothetical protein